MDLIGLMKRIVKGRYTVNDLSDFLKQYPDGAVIDVYGYSVQGYVTELRVVAREASVSVQKDSGAKFQFGFRLSFTPKSGQHLPLCPITFMPGEDVDDVVDGWALREVLVEEALSKRQNGFKRMSL